MAEALCGAATWLFVLVQVFAEQFLDGALRVAVDDEDQAESARSGTGEDLGSAIDAALNEPRRPLGGPDGEMADAGAAEGYSAPVDHRLDPSAAEARSQQWDNEGTADGSVAGSKGGGGMSGGGGGSSGGAN